MSFYFYIFPINSVVSSRVYPFIYILAVTTTVGAIVFLLFSSNLLSFFHRRQAAHLSVSYARCNSNFHHLYAYAQSYMPVYIHFSSNRELFSLHLLSSLPPYPFICQRICQSVMLVAIAILAATL